jgi:hypothetical protein
VDIDTELLKMAVSLSEGRNENDVVEEALREFVRARRIESLRKRLGNFELGLTHEELRRMREDE